MGQKNTKAETLDEKSGWFEFFKYNYYNINTKMKKNIKNKLNIKREVHINFYYLLEDEERKIEFKNEGRLDSDISFFFFYKKFR